MRLVLNLLSIYNFLSLSSATVAEHLLHERQLEGVDFSTLLELPNCILSCAFELLPKFDCSTAECFCNVHGSLMDSMRTCIQASCSSIEDQLKTIKFAAKVCRYETHTNAPRPDLVAYGLFSFATLFLVIRLLYRAPQLRGAGYGWDDWCILLCWPFALGMTLAAHFTGLYGVGKDLWLLSAEQLEKFFLWTYIGEPLYPTVTCLTKMALVLLYLRIWTPQSLENNSRFRIYCWVTLAVLIATNIAFVCSCLFACTPIEAGWTLRPGTDKPVHCIDRLAQGYALAGINIFEDFVVLLLPVRRVTKLRIGLWDKIGVLTMFMLGSLITVCSIVRTFYIYQTANVTNITYAYSFIGVWSLVEVYGTMICGCVPAAAGFFRRYWQPVTERITKSFRSAVTSLSTTTKHDEGAENDTELFCVRHGEVYQLEQRGGSNKGSGPAVASRSVESHDDSLGRDLEQRDSARHLGVLPDPSEIEIGKTLRSYLSPKEPASILGGKPTEQSWFDGRPSPLPLSTAEPPPLVLNQLGPDRFDEGGPELSRKPQM